MSCPLSVVRCPLSFVGCRLSVVGCHLSVVGCRLSVVGCHLSVVGCRLSVVGCRLSFVGCRLSFVGCRLSVVICQWAVARWGFVILGGRGWRGEKLNLTSEAERMRCGSFCCAARFPSISPPCEGGVRGRGVHASDIVNGFPLSQSRDKAAGRRPFERPVVGRAKITPPAPPSQRGERNRGAHEGAQRIGDECSSPQAATFHQLPAPSIASAGKRATKRGSTPSKGKTSFSPRQGEAPSEPCKQPARTEARPPRIVQGH